MLSDKHAALIAWGVTEQGCIEISRAIEERKKILITGNLRTGKTKFLNELIRLKAPDEHFEYQARLPMDEYLLEIDNQSKLASSLWGADYLIIDEGPIPLQKYLDYPQALIATQLTSDIRDIKYLEKNIYPFFDLIVTLNNYKSVWSVTTITVHDKLLYQAYNKFEAVQAPLDELYSPFLAPLELVRIEWLKELNPAEKAAVQLGNLNRSVENGGLACWYQAEGIMPKQDIPDLLDLCNLGEKQGIPFYVFLKEWLLVVQTQYKNTFVNNTAANIDALQKEYWSRLERYSCFDLLLEYLLNEKL
ncbi:hypothetical protein [Paenibacillus sp. Leaf72]|uniref:hypothetical protein n=1 Tax=Paenibacillus sp. Leaf72 TaxID=1736234 RepID=UPI0006FD8C83|nr:hypothetical protein [Paenibacillus sp. Leaf72]KQN96941.1 hypothetical protein ASF12_23005 [Paenibacillus sp. Leaf72]